MADEFSGYHVFSVHATIARFDGDIDREREFHCYIDADIFDSEQRYHEHQRTALAAERDAAVLRAEQAEARERALLSTSEEARQFLRQRDALKADARDLAAALRTLVDRDWHYDANSASFMAGSHGDAIRMVATGRDILAKWETRHGKA